MKSNKKPVISIIVPIYKSEAFLEKCIESLICQTLPGIEIILINDGSPDKSDVICNSYAKKDTRIKVIHKKNEGQAKAWQLGTELALADYLLFVDADDWLDKQTCEIAYQQIIDQNADVIFWPFINEFEHKSVPYQSIFQKDTLFQNKKMDWLKRRLIGFIGDEIFDPINIDAYSSVWGKLYKKSIIIENQIKYRDTFEIGSTDVLFNIHFFHYAKKAVYIHNFLTHYRRFNLNSLTKNYQFSMLKKMQSLFSYIQFFIDEKKLGNPYERALASRISVSAINIVLSITSENNKNSIKSKKNYLSETLNQPIFKASISNFDTSYLPVYWKIFFLFCKYQWVRSVYLLGVIMQKIR